MENKLDYSDKITEPFAITTIANFYDTVYNSFLWNEKTDDFDFSHYDLGIGLEVSVIITSNTQKVLSYQNSIRKDIKSIRGAKINSNGELSAWYGGSGFELQKLIIDRISRKNSKAKRHLSDKITECQLCLCIDDGGWYQREDEFEFLKTSKVVSEMIFSKLFIITSSLFLVYEKNRITSCNRKL